MKDQKTDEEKAREEKERERQIRKEKERKKELEQKEKERQKRKEEEVKKKQEEQKQQEKQKNQEERKKEENEANSDADVEVEKIILHTTQEDEEFFEKKTTKDFKVQVLEQNQTLILEITKNQKEFNSQIINLLSNRKRDNEEMSRRMTEAERQFKYIKKIN